MIRAAALAVLFIASVASAQPKRPQPAPPPAKDAPLDPYAEPAKPEPAKPDPKKADPKKPARGAPAAPGPAAPDDPYADPKPGKADPKAAPPKIDPTNPFGGPKSPPNGAPAAGAKKAPADPYGGGDDQVGPKIPPRVGLADVTAVQGLLAVQRLDGWLLFDRDGANPIARRLVSPEGHPTRPWFYMIPAKGQPVALVHDAEKRSFDHLVGTKLTYQGYRDLDKQLRALLKGVKSVALEYSPKAAVPAVSRVDAGTMELIRAAGAQVKSSDTLVQYTKAIWGDAGRTAHYVAAHHLVELRKETLAYVTKQLHANLPLTEYELQQRLVRGMTMRGLSGVAPVVAAGINTADPYYVPNASKTATIQRGDLIVISLAAKLDRPEGIYAAQTWVAIADTTVREDIKKAFETATLAREQAMSLIMERTRKNRPITGAEVDQATRAFLKKAGVADRVMHRTGHSIDNDLQGGGADLDDFEVKDTRILTPGTGFTIGPGLYFPGQFGVRSEVSVYFAPTGPEITTPAQDDIEPLLAR
jgi:Xaa-Pro dipeptidase